MILVGGISSVVVHLKQQNNEEHISQNVLESSEPYRRVSRGNLCACLCKTCVIDNEESRSVQICVQNGPFFRPRKYISVYFFILKYTNPHKFSNRHVWITIFYQSWKINVFQAKKFVSNTQFFLNRPHTSVVEQLIYLRHKLVYTDGRNLCLGLFFELSI